MYFVVNQILEQLEVTPQIRQCHRIGLKRTGAVQFIIFSARRADVVHQILKKAKPYYIFVAKIHMNMISFLTLIFLFFFNHFHNHLSV